MNHLPKLFKLIELTRTQVQQGYLLSGVYKNELSDLAQHHYLVTFIAWQLASNANAKGAKINIQKVLEFSLVHDLGELFGGDIAAPYARVNQKAKKAAKAFEAENHKYLSGFFGPGKKNFVKLSKEIMDAKSDEALIAKMADYIEATNFLVFLNKFKPISYKIAEEKISGWVKQIKDQTAKRELQIFLKDWLASLKNEKYLKQTFSEEINYAKN